LRGVVAGSPAAAGPSLYGASASAPAQFLEQAAGVYKRSFEGELASGKTYDAEDILEVVPVDASAAYVRLHLEFPNGHIAALWGVASYSAPDSLVYAFGEGEHHCVVTLAWTRGQVNIRADEDKTPGCRENHGMRASFNADFARSQRRVIRYMERLKDSRQYKAALAEYRGPPQQGEQSGSLRP
jgi:hypothetical protein